METQNVYLGLGGNLGDPILTFKKVLDEFSKEPTIRDLRCSPFYQTTPVSDIPQDDFVNAVCVFQTTMTIGQLREYLVAIEKELGKHPIEKDAPRIIDIDVLFYGNKHIVQSDFKVPHPRWSERLFVLQPLKDLTDEISFEDENGKVETIDLTITLKNFTNRHQEVVKKLEKVES